MASKPRAWKGKPNGQDRNEIFKEHSGFNRGKTKVPQSDYAGAGDLAMGISAKHNGGQSGLESSGV